jgi:hypothetical protein
VAGDDAQQHQSQDTPRLEFADTVEKTIKGLFSFVARYFCTLWFLSYRPRRIAEGYLKEAGAPLPSQPFTFLALGNFIIVKLIRIGLYMFLLLTTTLFASCEGKDTTQDHSTQYLQSHLSLPSLEELLFIGMPMLVVMLIIVRILALLMMKRYNSEANDRFMTSACYTVGYQYAFLIVLAGAVLLLISGLDAISEDLDLFDNDIVAYVFWGIIGLILVLWPAVIFLRMSSILIDKQEYRMSSRWLRGFFRFIAALIIATVPLSASVGIAYPLAKRDFEKFGPDPYLKIALIDIHPVNVAPADRVQGEGIELSISIYNNSPKELRLRKQMDVITKDHKRYDADISDTSQPRAPMVVLKPKQSEWMRIRVRGVSADGKTTLPKDSLGRMVFKSVGYSSKGDTITANIRNQMLVFTKKQ